ncbi:MAG: hypothetical protein RSC84_02595 [Peptostreptococcaceae bacterium]
MKNKYMLKKFVLDWLLMLGILFIITFLWQNTERLLYGEITPRIIDSAITLILAWSLYGNLENWLNKND